MGKQINYISSDSLFEFAEWLIKQDLRGYALLVAHGSQLGLRMSKQLKLTWGDFIDKDLKIKSHLKIKGEKDRPINSLLAEFTLNAHLSTDKLEDPIYTTSLNQAIETYNLRRDLSRHYHSFLLSKRLFSIYDPKYFSPQILEIAWVRDFLLDHGRHPDAFKFMSKHLKHNNLGYTIDMVGLYPIEPKLPELRYDYVEQVKLKGVNQKNEIQKKLAKMEEITMKIDKVNGKTENSIKNEIKNKELKK